MRNVPENELFSAYLDGELTAAEQAEVEQLLAASPEARQLMEELRALGTTLQSLPVYKLSEDLGPEVLRRAERRILTGPVEPSSLPLEAERATPVWRMVARRLARPRTWIWPAAAVAVALLLAIFLPQRGQRVAHAPAEKSMASTAVSNVPLSGEALSIGAAEEAAPALKSTAGPMKQPAPPAIVAERPMERAVGVNGLIPLGMKEDEKGGQAGQPGMMPAKTAPAPAPAASPMMAAKQPAPPPAPASSSEVKKSVDKAEKPAEASSRPMKAAKPAAPVQLAEKGRDGAIAPGEMWIVTCDVAPEAISNGILDHVLSKRHIARAEPAPKDIVELNRAAALYSYAAPFRMKAKAPSRVGGEEGAHDKFGGDAGKVVYVHAQVTLADLQAVLADLKARPQMVASVSGATVRVDTDVPQAKQWKVGTPPGMPGAAGRGAGLGQAQAAQSRTTGAVAGGGAMPGWPAQQADDSEMLQNAPRIAAPGMSASQRTGRMSQTDRGAVRSQTAAGYGTLRAQQSAAVEQAFAADQRSVPALRLKSTGPLPAAAAEQLAVKRPVLFVLRVVDAGGIAAKKGQVSKAAAARVEAAESKSADSFSPEPAATSAEPRATARESAKAARPAEAAPPAKPAQKAGQ